MDMIKGCLGTQRLGGRNLQNANCDLKSQIKDYWEKNVNLGKWDTLEEQIKGIEEYHYKLHPWLPKIYNFSKYEGKRVLEVGCGQGVDLSRFAKNGANVTGIDLTEEGIRIARERFRILGLNGNLLVEDAENLPFQENYFDMVYSHGVLHHTPDTQKAIDEIHRVLKPGGDCVVLIYHKYSLHNFYRCMGRLNYWILKKMGREDVWLKKARAYAKANIEKNIWGYGADPVSGARNFLRMEVNEDIHCPLVKTYSRRGAKMLFKKFSNIETDCFYFNPPTINLKSPVSMVLGTLYKFLNLFLNEEKITKMFGWDLFIKAKKPR